MSKPKRQTKNGSQPSPLVRDISAIPSPKARQHHRSLAPIPEEAAKNPMDWAEKHIESMAPVAAKELEWALKFGSDTMRYNAAKDMLAMKGLTTKPKETGTIPQAMVFINVNGNMPGGAPAMPFMNAAPVVAAPALDAPKTPVTVPNAPIEAPSDEES